MRSSLINHLKKIDKFTDQHALFFVAILILVILRIPNFYEPYWYGDEGIYLTIGQAMNKGVKLYSEIVDHKTPIIYFLAQADSQLNFRILNFAWMTATTLLFYVFAMRLTGRRLAAGIATILFTIFTTLPWFEGNIPNGELFVIGFVMLGAVLLSYTKYFTVLQEAKKTLKLKNRDRWLLVAAGAAFGLGLMTKVPALFDIGAFAAVGYFIAANDFSFEPHHMKKWTKLLWQVLRAWAWLIIGIIIPVAATIVYFVSQGSGQDYLQYGLLYNFHYAGNWGLPFDNALLLKLFTLPGKFAVAAGLILAVTAAKKYVPTIIQFLFAWFVLSLFGSLLSNRPYPHYFMQTIPALSLLAGIALKEIADLVRRKRKLSAHMASTLAITTFAVALFAGVLIALNVGLYPTKIYYQNWWQLRTGKISISEYNQRFNHLMKDNYEAAALLRASGEDRLFIWGTNPMLYALSGATPTGKFTVSFHIKDLNAYDDTFADLEIQDPTYIVVMKNEKDDFPDFYQHLQANYRPFRNFDNFTLWRKMSQ